MATRRSGPQVNGWIEISDQGTTTVLRIGGDLDIASRDAIEAALRRAIDVGSRVVIDLADLSFCDSSGLAVFIAAHERLTEAGGTLAIRNLPAHIRRVFDVAGVAHLVGVTEGDGFPSPDESPMAEPDPV